MSATSVTVNRTPMIGGLLLLLAALVLLVVPDLALAAADGAASTNQGLGAWGAHIEGQAKAGAGIIKIISYLIGFAFVFAGIVMLTLSFKQQQPKGPGIALLVLGGILLSIVAFTNIIGGVGVAGNEGTGSAQSALGL